jgi:hypothetical protein
MINALENTTCATIGAEPIKPSEGHEFFPRFNEVCVSRSFVFCVNYCLSLSSFYFDHCIVCPSEVILSHIKAFKNSVKMPKGN